MTPEDFISYAIDLILGFQPNYLGAQIAQYGPIGNLVHFLKVFAYVTTPILLALIIWTFSRFASLTKSPQQQSPSLITEMMPPAPVQTSAAQARWEEISRHIASTNEGEWKFAVIEADKLIDDILRSSGYPGETMGERLMNIEPGQIQTLQGLWDAHKTRNRLVHDTNYFLRYAEARRSVELYGDTLRELGAL